MDDVIITRVATAADALELARLNALFNNVVEPPERLAARLAATNPVEMAILAEMDGRVVGFACLRLVPCVLYDEPYAELTELFVEAGYRRRGVGRALVVYAEQLARAGGATRLHLLTGFENAAGQAFYRALGYTDDSLAMVKCLNE